MTELVWSEALRLDHVQMDRTHEEFVALLADARAAADPLPAFERLLEHTVAHFAQEERWMLATGFAPENCHARQHAMVLQVMDEALRLAREEGHTAPMGVLLAELAQWFPAHAQMMDAGLAQHLAALGFDPLTGEVAAALPEVPLTHCGGSGCR